MSVTIADLAQEAQRALIDAPKGTPLTAFDEAMIVLGLAVSVTALDTQAIDEALATAFRAGATVAQVQEVVSLISGLGVHSLMATAVRIVSQAEQFGAPVALDFTAEQQALWDKHVGDDPFWTAFEVELPGFLKAMLQLSPDQFAAFFDYCAVPWKNGQLRARLKELIALASDATPTHRFRPGFRVHLANAIKLGAGRSAIERALELAAIAPEHVGTR